MSKKERKDQSAAMAFLGAGLSVGVELAVAAWLGNLAGKWLDEKMGWAPWGLMLGLVLFLGGALTHAIIKLNYINNRMNSDD